MVKVSVDIEGKTHEFEVTHASGKPPDIFCLKMQIYYKVKKYGDKPMDHNPAEKQKIKKQGNSAECGNGLLLDNGAKYVLTGMDSKLPIDNCLPHIRISNDPMMP